jgi:colanic acid/amylovoran biosynthesis protein
MKKIGVIAATFSGNRGAEAMLTVAIDHIKNNHPGDEVHVLTYSPSEDLEEDIPSGVYLHSATPQQIVVNWLPLSILTCLLPFIRKPMTSTNFLNFRSLSSLDLVIDLAGVSYMDSRKKFLLYNVLSTLPFILCKVPVAKMSQAVGPIRSHLNRLCASFMLSRHLFVATRGDQTHKYLQEININNKINSFRSNDLAFLLQEDCNYNFQTKKRGDIAFIVSSLMAKKHANYCKLIAETIIHIQQKGHEVDIICHSWRKNSSIRNNDIPTANEICSHIKSLGQFAPNIYGENMNSRTLKALIGSYKVAVTSRFHGMISSLSQCVPTIVVGWSHKYREVLDFFNLEDCALQYEQLSEEILAHNIIATLNNREIIQKKIKDNLDANKELSLKQLNHLSAHINQIKDKTQGNKF